MFKKPRMSMARSSQEEKEEEEERVATSWRRWMPPLMLIVQSQAGITRPSLRRK
jgi:hypothetical protein